MQKASIALYFQTQTLEDKLWKLEYKTYMANFITFHAYRVVCDFMIHSQD